MMKGLHWVVVACLVAAGCGGGVAQVVRGDATDTPERFQVLDAATGARSEVGPGPACASPLVDPRDGTRLALERSSGGVGDYAVDGSRYGLAADELLRVDCRNGVAIGRVSR
jgi:hypothetical protein